MASEYLTNRVTELQSANDRSLSFDLVSSLAIFVRRKLRKSSLRHGLLAHCVLWENDLAVLHLDLECLSTLGIFDFDPATHVFANAGNSPLDPHSLSDVRVGFRQ